MEDNVGSSVKLINSKIFDCFKTLTSCEDNKRFNGGVILLQSLSKAQKSENKDKEIKYALKRLIRGVGASTTTSRAGFFTTLVGFFNTIHCSNINVCYVLELLKTQLHVGGTITNKEDSDAIVGQILICNAILHSKQFENMSSDDLKKIIQILLSASKYKTYHNSLAFAIIVGFLEKISENQFKETVWPLLESAILQPWDKQNINTVHCWIVISNKFTEIVNAKYMKMNLGGSQLLNKNNFDIFFNIFWENTSINILTHPAFEKLGKYLASCRNLEEFWLEKVDKCLVSASKIKELETIKILTDIITYVDERRLRISELLTDNVIKMIISSLKNMKRKDETFKVFYEEFFNALYQSSSKFDDDENVKIIHKLILHPGVLGIEKYTTHRIIHQIMGNLGSDGVRTLFETYKNIFLNKISKDKNDTSIHWLNVERESAAYMLQTLIGHKSVQTEFVWRGQQLLFLMVSSLFHFNSKGEVVTKNNDCGIIENIFSLQMKNIFYASLQSKLPRLDEERKILLNLVLFCNDILQKKNFNKYLKSPIDENILKAWNEMYTEVNKKRKLKSDNKLKLIFDILLLHMGLQLFREPEMAQVAIFDLEKCMEKSNKKNAKKPNLKAVEVDDEPEWIEVVVDLFLHLLSQNASSLRNVVNTVFPHLCDSMTLTAIHQILSVLDMKDGKNPLSDENEDIKDVDREYDDSEDNDSDNENKKEKIDESTGDEDDDDDMLFEEEEEEEGNFNDQLRNAVASALESVTSDPDKDSIDLNDMDEEQGKRLDEALASAFRALKRPAQNKRSKEYRVQTTTTMHFRIRVLDLIELYVQHKPSLLISIEIMLALYDMIEFCNNKELQPLLNKVQKTLGKLLELRQFSKYNNNNDENLTVNDICQYFRMIIDKKLTSPTFETHNKLKTKCCIFLIANSELLRKDSSDDKNVNNKIIDLLNEYLDDFINSRNPSLNITLLNDIFKMRWAGIWNLAVNLAENGLSEKTRLYRRTQIFELLKKLYKNYEHIRSYTKLAKTSFKSIEKLVQKYLVQLSQKNEVSSKEFELILNLLFDINKCHNKLSIKDYFDRNVLIKSIQDIRVKIKIESIQTYIRICNIFGMKIIRNSDIKNNVSSEKISENGIYDEDLFVNINIEEKRENKKVKSKISKQARVNENNNVKSSIKRKNNQDNRKTKKLKKEKQLQIASNGLNGNFAFANAPVDVILSDGSIHED